MRPLMGPDDPEPRAEPLESRVEQVCHADALMNPTEWPEPSGPVLNRQILTGAQTIRAIVPTPVA